MVGALQHIHRGGSDLAEHAHAQARARERVAIDHRPRQAQGHAHASHLILEQLAQRFHQTHAHALGQTADIVMRLDHVRLAGLGAGRLDHVGIDGALRQPAHVAMTRGFFLEHLDEQPADDLALGFRIVDAGQRGEEALARVDADHAQMHVLGELRHHLIALLKAQQAGVDEDAQKLLADGPMQQAPPPPRNRRRRTSPSNTVSLPTCSRTRAMPSSMIRAAVHSVAQPHASTTKRRNMVSP